MQPNTLVCPCKRFSHPPALVRPPFLNVADVVPRAVDRHVVVVTGHIERLAEFNGPLKKKKV